MHAFSAYFLHLVDHYGYAGLLVSMVLANIGAPIGSELILPAAGALAATKHLSSIWIAFAVAVFAELAGQTIGYAVGHFGGRRFVQRYGPLIRFHQEEMAKVDRFFAKYGSFAIFICRFVPVIRGIVGIPAGIARMPLLPFYLWTLLGSAGFCGGFMWLGYALGKKAAGTSGTFDKVILIVVVLAIAGAVAYALLQRRRARA